MICVYSLMSVMVNETMKLDSFETYNIAVDDLLDIMYADHSELLPLDFHPIF